jgi:hypothetical protein
MLPALGGGRKIMPQELFSDILKILWTCIFKISEKSSMD